MINIILRCRNIGEFEIVMPEAPHVDDYVKVPYGGELEFCIETRSWEWRDGQWFLICGCSHWEPETE